MCIFSILFSYISYSANKENSPHNQELPLLKIILIQGWYCEEKLDSGHSKGSKGSWGHCRILLKVCVLSTFSITWLTYNVVIVFICWSCTEVYPVSLANLLDLFRWSRETKETWMKLYNRRNMYLIRDKAVGILNRIKKKNFSKELP